jgi:hypothetical protein
MTEEIVSTSEKATRWRNPTEQTVRFSLCLTGVTLDQRQKVVAATSRQVEIKPGQEVVLPSRFDSAIQFERHGRIQSGLAPQLVRMQNGNPVPRDVHPALEGRTVAVVPDRSVDSSGREARLRARRVQS